MVPQTLLIMDGPFLHYGNIRLLNLPHAKAVADEVLVEDCYRKEEVPYGAIVLDVGGFYGEFGIWCAVERKCFSWIYEPSPSSKIVYFNVLANAAETAWFEEVAIAKIASTRSFHYNHDHPAGSTFNGVGNSHVCCRTLAGEILFSQNFIGSNYGQTPRVVVKLDCEGAEREIFQDESWLKNVYIVTMEWHNKDGHHYKEILERHGFDVSLDQTDPEVVRGMLFAKRKTQ
jgi:FkbM family methyltransferase